MEKFKITIPKMALVKTSLSTHYSNSHHLQFMFNVHALVKTADKLKLHLTDELLKSWADCIDMETELNKVANATLHAEQMAALDRQRDTLLTNLFGVIRVQQKSPVQAVAESARKLNKALAVYLGIQSKAADAETAEVRGLLKDLERFSTEMTALGLAPVVAELKAVNEKFQTVYNERQVKALDEKLPALKEVRTMTDAVFDAVCHYIEASYLLAATDEDRSPIERLVDQINQEIDHFKTAYKQSSAQKKPSPAVKERETKLKAAIPAFAEKAGYDEGALTYTGKGKGAGMKRQYELAIKDRKTADGKPATIWVVMAKDGSLSLVENVDKKAEPKENTEFGIKPKH
ncbi:MAG: hypothetical protein HXO05_09900 [Prevotella salivae]|nr:hypothetical protein [Segatella salivae]